MTIDDYVFDPENNAGNRDRFSILQGAFQYVSGLIAKKPNPDVNIETSVASLGIRGTNFTGGYIEGQYGVYVDEGMVSVKNNAGEVLVSQGQGTFILSRSSTPSAPAAWSPPEIQYIRQLVSLKHQQFVPENVPQNIIHEQMQVPGKGNQGPR